MKTLLPLTTFLVIQFALLNKSEGDHFATYKLIQKTKDIPGDVDTAEVNRLPEHLKALAALYSSVGGSNCNGETCELTTALGLGKQGSELQKTLIKKYFRNDKIADLVLKQDCYLRPSGATSFSDFQNLTITQKGNIITVDYNLYSYSRGKSANTRGPDTYTLKNSTFRKIKRHLWNEMDK